MNKGYSQEYIADVIGVSQKTYSNMENDKSNITFDTLKQLIEFYEIDVTTLDLEKFILEGKLRESTANNPNGPKEKTVNPVSEKLIHQMEERIVELKTLNEDLKYRLKKFEGTPIGTTIPSV